MAQLIFGKSIQGKKIIFANDSEFFEALGFLCKNDGTTKLFFERNDLQGARGPEGRIHFYVNRIYPLYFDRSFTVGVGRAVHRTNNTQYRDYIMNNHAIVDGAIQNVANVVATVPAANLVDFNRGLIL